MTAVRLRASSAMIVLLDAAQTSSVAAAQGEPVCSSSPAFGSVIVFAALALIPLGFIAATSFIKLSIVLSILRNALGIGQTPSGTVIAVLAAVLTFYVMGPVGSQMLEVGSPSAAGIDWDKPTSRASLSAAFKTFQASQRPLTRFLSGNAGKREVALFVSLGQRGQTRFQPADREARELSVVLPAFLLTELKEAFQIGFLVYLPFLVIDMVIANLLLAMGMGMVSPAAISLPFKLLIFVLVDGWYVLAKALVLGYNL